MSSFQSMFRPVMTVLSAPTHKVRVQARAAPEIAVTLANRPRGCKLREMRRVMMCSCWRMPIVCKDTREDTRMRADRSVLIAIVLMTP